MSDDKPGLFRFASVLRNLRDASQGIALCFAKLAEEAEAQPISDPYQNEAMLVKSGVMVREESLLSLSQDLETMKGNIIAALGVPKHLLYGPIEPKEQQRLEKQQAHLADWFTDLQVVVDALRPNHDLPTFRAQVEDLLNDDRIKPFR